MEQKRLGAYHLDSGDPETFVVGQLLRKDLAWLLMRDVTPDGCWNGLALYQASDLVAEETNTAYCRKLERLLAIRGEAAPEAPAMTGSPLTDLLSFAKAHRRVVGLELFQSGTHDVEGIADLCTDRFVRIRQLTELGEPDGVTYVALSAVTRAFCGSRELHALELLAEPSG